LAPSGGGGTPRASRGVAQRQRRRLPADAGRQQPDPPLAMNAAATVGSSPRSPSRSPTQPQPGPGRRHVIALGEDTPKSARLTAHGIQLTPRRFNAACMAAANVGPALADQPPTAAVVAGDGRAVVECCAEEEEEDDDDDEQRTTPLCGSGLLLPTRLFASAGCSSTRSPPGGGSRSSCASTEACSASDGSTSARSGGGQWPSPPPSGGGDDELEDTSAEAFVSALRPPQRQDSRRRFANQRTAMLDPLLLTGYQRQRTAFLPMLLGGEGPMVDEKRPFKQSALATAVDTPRGALSAFSFLFSRR